MCGVDLKRAAVERVVAWAAERLPFPVESNVWSHNDEVVVDLVVDGRLMCGVEAVADAGVLASRLSRCAGRRADEYSTVDVSDLLTQWWHAEDGDDFADIAADTFDIDAVEERLEAVQSHVLAAVESDAEFYRNLRRLAAVLGDYRD